MIGLNVMCHWFEEFWVVSRREVFINFTKKWILIDHYSVLFISWRSWVRFFSDSWLFWKKFLALRIIVQINTVLFLSKIHLFFLIWLNLLNVLIVFITFTFIEFWRLLTFNFLVIFFIRLNLWYQIVFGIKKIIRVVMIFIESIFAHINLFWII